MDFEFLSKITGIELIAAGRKIRELKRLEKAYGKGRWRKLKGLATLRFHTTGEARQEEVHWYEAHGIGKREFKIKYRG